MIDDIGNNTNNTNDEQIKNIDNSPRLTINTSDNDKKSTNNVLVNLPLMKMILHL